MTKNSRNNTIDGMFENKYGNKIGYKVTDSSWIYDEKHAKIQRGFLYYEIDDKTGRVIGNGDYEVEYGDINDMQNVTPSIAKKFWDNNH